MGIFIDDEIYAQDSESYTEIFLNNRNNRGTENDKKTKELTVNYDEYRNEMSN